jgi:hypothetical protein
MQTKQLAIVFAAALSIVSVGVVIIGHDAAPSRQEIRDHDAADAAIEQLLRLDARFKAGINLLSYSEDLAAVLYAVDAFDASGEAAGMPGVAAAISESHAHYEWVRRIWPAKLGKFTRYTLEEVPNDEDAARYFGHTPESSRAAVQEVREWAMNSREPERYIDLLVARVLSRAGDLGRDARKQLQTLTAGR